MSRGSLSDPAIRLEGVTVEFGTLRALDNVSFTVPAGSVTGLIGRNGAGKTTAIRILAGLLQPSHPDAVVEIFGNSFRTSRKAILEATGYLLSEPALFPYLTPRETLAFIAEANGIPSGEAERRARELIAFFGLVDAGERLVDGFSTGMLKRLELAAALIHAPRLLVLDEPFESLDPLMVRRLKQLLGRYAADGGTVLLSSHLIDAVDEICDRVTILEGGRVVTTGRTQEAKASIADRLTTGSLEDLYASLVPDEVGPALDWLNG